MLVHWGQRSLQSGSSNKHSSHRPEPALPPLLLLPQAPAKPAAQAAKGGAQSKAKPAPAAVPGASPLALSLCGPPPTLPSGRRQLGGRAAACRCGGAAGRSAACSAARFHAFSLSHTPSLAGCEVVVRAARNPL